jgi:hypothetical protein
MVDFEGDAGDRRRLRVVDDELDDHGLVTPGDERARIGAARHRGCEKHQ